MKQDYRFIRYWMDADGNIWSGPHSPMDTLHYGKVKEEGALVLERTERHPLWVEMTPLQAARHLEYKALGFIVK